jgi:photosystem II stability/assembly factor-like uncharacterized protein
MEVRAMGNRWRHVLTGSAGVIALALLAALVAALAGIPAAANESVRPDHYVAAISVLSTAAPIAVGGRSSEPTGAVQFLTDDGGSGWDAEPPRWPNNFPNLNDVSLIDASNGWAVGDGGTIIHTSDGGGTWGPQSSGVTQTLNAVHFSSDTTGWAVGDGGVIVRTGNGGTGWETQTSGTANDLNDVVFTPGASIGFAVGDAETVLATTDTGANWQAKTSPAASMARPWTPTPTDLFALYASSDTTAWVGGADGLLAVTGNGGTSWARKSTGTADTLHDIEFTSAATGWAVGTWGKVHNSVDGGETWSYNYISSSYLYDIDFAPTDPMVGWAVGGDNSIFATVDGGANWVRQYPKATSVDIWADQAIYHYGDTVHLAGVLKADDLTFTAMPTLEVNKKEGSGVWNWNVALASLDSTSQTYLADQRVYQNTTFKYWFAGDATHTATYSNHLTVPVYADVDNPPVAPPAAPVARTFRVAGAYRPWRAGTTLVYFYKWNGSRWVLMRIKSAANSRIALSGKPGTRYILGTLLGQRGRWMIRARVVSAYQAATWSPKRYMRIY